ncbi:MAG: HAMP domain-containing protein [Deltaproteobacteria bacterium]|nr:HAMP domain-containing protein [Deltaproteobacteria bacterium]
MTLRNRLALAMLLCALAPLVGAGALARGVLARRYVEADARRREAALGRVTETLSRRAADQDRALARFCARDPLIDQAVLALGAGQFGQDQREELGAVLPDAAAALGLEVLAVVRADGEVLASAHYPGQAGRRDPDTWRRAAQARSREPLVRKVRVRAQGGPRDLLVLESACVRRLDRVAVAVAGGRALEALVREVVTEEGVQVEVVEGRTTPVGVGVFERALPLRGMDDRTAATVVVRTTDTALRRVRAELDALLLAAALVAGLAALLLAVLLAPPLARPIREVAEAADRIARGDRVVHLREGSGGEVGRLVAAFNHMTRALDEAEGRLRRAERMAAWRDMARQMAHEIKNPLTPIRMAVELLRKARQRGLEDFDALFDEETRVVLDEVGRLRRLVEDFSRFARAPRPRPEALDVHELLAHVVELHGAQRAKVSLALEGEPGPLRGDRDQLTQVLVNLVSNGCIAAEERALAAPGGPEPAVRVTCSSAGEGALRWTVRDNGAGIPESVRARLFEPYVTSRKGGTGLGLAITYRIVTDHGGHITARSEAVGTTFVVELPRQGPPEPGPEAEGEP